MTTVAAVDVGATSGRVMVARLQDDAVAIAEASRFPNRPRQQGGRWTWDVGALSMSVEDGLRHAVRSGAAAWGIDTWAVDYGVLRDGRLVGPVYCYRDPRHAEGVARVDAAIPWEELYTLTGTQFMAINTIYQLAAEDAPRLREGSTFLMVPDLLSHWATGALATDVTNASSTGMVDVRTRQWSAPVLGALGLPASAFLPLDEPGSVRGESRQPGLNGIPLIGVATHDTASAFVGTPIADRDAALIVSLGTWALVGAESAGALPTEEARAINVTHELGVDGTVRVLRNVTGMWLLEECRRHWASQDGVEPRIETLLDAAERAEPMKAVLDVDDPELAVPGQGPQTIERHLVGRWDGSRGAVVRTLLESLVVRLAERSREIERLLRTPRDTIHVVGGASRMALLMQWLADATGKAVVAGPVEATALGNAAVQWRSLGAVASIAEARARVARMPEITVYEPRGDRAVWDALAARLGDREAT